MLPKARRLTGEEVRRALRGGRILRGTFLSLRIGAPDKRTQCAVVVSKKVARLAVDRNRLRRILYRGLVTLSLPRRPLVFFLERLPKDMSKKAFNEALFKDLQGLVQKTASHV